MTDTDLLTCDCGSTTFTISRDGLIECAECKHPTDGHMATPANVLDALTRRGVEIVEEAQ